MPPSTPLFRRGHRESVLRLMPTALTAFVNFAQESSFIIIPLDYLLPLV